MVSEGALNSNPFRSVPMPKIARAKVYVPTAEEIRRLVAMAPTNQARVLITLAATTMLRLGELLALRYPDDVDFKKRRIFVTGTLSENYDGQFVRGEPKTASSRRVVALPEIAASAIQALIGERSATRVEEAAELPASPWLFQNARGGPVNDHNFRFKLWGPTLRAAGLPHNMHFHALRHAGNSLLLDAGVPVLVVAARCGHADTRMTLDRYGHIVRAGADEGAALVTNEIFGDLLRPEIDCLLSDRGANNDNLKAPRIAKKNDITRSI